MSCLWRLVPLCVHVCVCVEACTVLASEAQQLLLIVSKEASGYEGQALLRASDCVLANSTGRACSDDDSRCN